FSEIHWLAEVRPDAIQSALSSIEVSNRCARFVDQPDPCTDKLGLRIPVKMSDASSEPIRMIPIIGIEDGDKIAIFRQLEPARQGHVRTLVFLRDKLDPCVFNRTNNIDGIILGPIVNNH